MDIKFDEAVGSMRYYKNEVYNEQSRWKINDKVGTFLINGYERADLYVSSFQENTFKNKFTFKKIWRYYDVKYKLIDIKSKEIIADNIPHSWLEKKLKAYYNETNI